MPGLSSVDRLTIGLVQELPIGIPKSGRHLSSFIYLENSPVSIGVEAQVASLVMKKVNLDDYLNLVSIR